MTRRMMLTGALGLMATLATACVRFSQSKAAAKTQAPEKFEFVLSDDQWRARLTPAQFSVLRRHDTEAAYSSPLENEHRVGTYACAGCDLALFSSKTKFESGTGWPSFYAPLKNAISTSTDYLLGYPRTEVHCRRCGGHLGHVFDDGPKPTGLRYCMNSAALKLVDQGHD